MAQDRVNTRLVWYVKWLGKWLLLFYVLGIYQLSPVFKDRGTELGIWLAFYLVYLLVMEFSSWIRRFYNQPVFRILRIHAMALFASLLVALTGGSDSGFWFVYLWSLFGAASYFGWIVTMAIYSEIAMLYLLSSIAAVGSFSVNFNALLANLTAMFLVTGTLRYFRTEESELRFAKILDLVQQDVDAAIHLKEVLDRIIARAVESVNGKDGTLMLMDQSGVLHSRTRSGNIFPEGRSERTFKLGEGIAGYVAQSNKPYICNDTKVDGRFVPVVLGSRSIRSLVSVPIVWHGRTLGVINVDHSEANHFSANDAKLLTAVAGQTATSIEQAELLECLGQISSKAVADDANLSEHIADILNRLTGYPVTVWELNELRELSIGAQSGLTSGQILKEAHDWERQAVEIAISEQEIRQVHGNQSSSNFMGDEIVKEALPCVLAIPLFDGRGDSVGALSVLSPAGKWSSPREIDVLRTFGTQASAAVVNASLFQKERRRADAMNLLQAISAKIGLMLDEEEILDLIIDGALKLLGMEAGVIHLVDESMQKVIRSYEVPRNFGHPVPRFSQKTGMTWEIVNTRQTIPSPDITKDPLINPGMLSMKIKSSIGTPLMVGGKVLGALYLCDFQPHFLTEYEKGLLEILAGPAAVAINNSRVFREREERATRLQGLQEATTSISAQPMALDEVQYQIVNKLSDMFRPSSCAIRLLDANTGGFLPRVATGLLSNMIVLPPVLDLLSRNVINTMSPLYLEEDDAIDLPHGFLAPWEDLLEMKVKALALLPLKSKGENVGILYLLLYEPYRFTENDKQVLHLFANHAVITLENAKLVKELNQRLESSRALQKKFETVSQIAIDLTGMSTFADLSYESLASINQEFYADAALYKSELDNPLETKLEDSVPIDFKLRLVPRCSIDETLLFTQKQEQGGYWLRLDCRSRGHRFEGFILVKRVSTSTQQARDFDESERVCLQLLADAIGHTLQKLRADVSISKAH